MIQHTHDVVVQFIRKIATTIPCQVWVSSQFTTAAPAIPIVKITRLLAKMTKVLSVVMAASYCFGDSVEVASMPPRPMVSTAEEGTITMAPFSLIASYSMFMARKCSATGFS